MNKTKVHIETQQLSNYIKLFNDVLQTELKILESSVVLILGPLEIIITKKKTPEIYPIHIEFQVPNIDDFKSRLDFFIFRNSNIELSVSHLTNSIQIIDFEGRKWTFSS